MNTSVNAAALQDHLMRQLDKKSTKRPSLAQKLGLVPGPAQPLTADQWEEVKINCKDPGGNCPICLELFKDRPQLILTCSHVFHRACFDSFKRLTGTAVKCPVCRSEVKETTAYDGGLKAWREQCATRLQAFFRASWSRKQLELPAGSLLARARVVRKLRSINARVEAQSIKRQDFMTAFLAAVDRQTNRDFKEIRIGLRALAENRGPVNFIPPDSKWSDPLRACLDRNDSECPICFEAFRGTRVSLLSCSHVFHEVCITNVEDFLQQTKCPVCREPQYTRIALSDLVN